MKAANNSTAANNTDQKRQKMGEGREGVTEDTAKPGYSTCNRCTNRTKTVRLVVIVIPVSVTLT